LQLDHSLPRIGFLAGAVFLLGACGGSSGSPPAAAPGADAGSPGADAGSPGVDAGSSGADAGSSGADAGSPIAIASIGPIPVAASQETTVCIVTRLGNTEALVATSFVSDLAPGSHHLILYRSSETAEQTTPFACSPFQGVLSGDVPLLIATRAHLEYDLPGGVGVQLAADQMVKIEAHYINTTAAQIEGSGTVSITGTPLADAGTFLPADVGLWGTTNINIPAEASFQTPVNFQVGVAGTKIFAMTTHEHQLGTEAEVWSSASAGDVSDKVADDTNWAAPAFETFDPAIAMNGTNGLSYQCSWKNPSSSAVSFGESALDEMCFVILYYYPSFGTDLCLDGQCQARSSP
jgi:hypothetical protein